MHGRATTVSLLALFAALASGCGDGASEPDPEPGAPAARTAPDGSAAPSPVARMIDIARSGPFTKRPQAAARLGTMGAPAIAALRELVAREPLADLGPELLQPMAELEADDLRERLWTAANDVTFPYRPAAAAWLARTARAGEWARFEALEADPLSAVRAAAIDAIGTLDDRALTPVLEAALRDPSDAVRRRAADWLVTWGHDFALRWLLEDLFRSDRYFDLETGKNARYESARVLRRLLDDRHLFGYEPREAPTAAANVAALEQLARLVSERIGVDERVPPPFARRSDVAVDGVLGLELRSCRRGEFFLAVTADDRLVVGTGHPVEFQLAPGAAERLAELVAARTAGSQTDLWGELGCDVECYRVRTAGAADRTRVLRVMKGPEEIEDLRPDALDDVARALLAEIPDTIEGRPGGRAIGDAEATFEALLTEALRSVGGELR